MIELKARCPFCRKTHMANADIVILNEGFCPCNECIDENVQNWINKNIKEKKDENKSN